MKLPFQKVLVTGGAGFIGSHVCEALLSRGIEVVVIDDFNDFYDPAIKEANIAAIRDRITLVRGDIRDAGLIEGLFSAHRFDAIIHLAARAGVRPSISDPKLYFTTNIDGTFNLLDACRHHGVKRFIFASSSSVYGINEKVPFAETDPVERTISPYAATKISGEHICSNYSHLFGIHCACLRFFTVYGPRQRPDLAISKFTRCIREGQPIDQYGDGSTARDYTYIEDIVEGVLAAAAYTEVSAFEIFNLGGSATTTLSELISLVEDAVGNKAIIRQLPDQQGDVPRTYADVSKAQRLLGYEPKTPIREGIRKYAAWQEASRD
ncbi:SDR family NAD(P)-dependent oxidoreductase [Luteolibacter sp. SL250]|uniref:SDR family NAD(P)-dependent oxidoreductase n=1 Tax=Luteolibacter sp. SL250 TaxID=2995170 RepID=UPI00226D9BD3|nr:SDR family NAD(P)-dependent oxidoreductase [Luteolibacter sp. SL250]WAC20182.1 SDR family NAD(P)-dependent oxidoreductase [Luteolibacter sp. SL250]